MKEKESERKVAGIPQKVRYTFTKGGEGLVTLLKMSLLG